MKSCISRSFRSSRLTNFKSSSSRLAFSFRGGKAYRRALWDSHSNRVEVWLEKDALSGMLVEETSELDVPLTLGQRDKGSSINYLRLNVNSVVARTLTGLPFT